MNMEKVIRRYSTPEVWLTLYVLKNCNIKSLGFWYEQDETVRAGIYLFGLCLDYTIASYYNDIEILYMPNITVCNYLDYIAVLNESTPICRLEEITQKQYRWIYDILKDLLIKAKENNINAMRDKKIITKIVQTNFNDWKMRGV